MDKAVIFDMDGILFDTENLYIQCWKQLGGCHQLEDIEATLKECIGTNEERTKSIFKSHYGESFDIMYYREQVRSIFLNYTKTHGMPMKPGVYELLGYLKENGYRIGLASSTKIEDVKRELKEAGIYEYFEVLIGGDMVKTSKPSPDIYLLACEQLGIEPKIAIAIEDSLNGIRAAYAAGMKPIMVPDLMEPTPEIQKMLYQKLDSLLEVKEFLMKQE